MTVDDFAQKYMRTVAYIFSALNELRSPTGGTLTQNPEAYQLKVDDNKLYIRNQANTDWILLGDVQENFGFRTSASDAFMHESDVADSGTAGKLIRADASGKLNADILGNAAKIADKAIQMGLDLADEDRLVYDKDTDTITNRPLQFRVDGDKIYARKDATTGWVLLGDLKQNLGFRSSTDDAFLTEPIAARQASSSAPMSMASSTPISSATPARWPARPLLQKTCRTARSPSTAQAMAPGTPRTRAPSARARTS